MKIYLDQTVYDAAIERIEYLFDEFKNVCVWHSGGKDSTVVYNLALQVAERKGRLPLPVLFIDQEVEWQGTIDHIAGIMYDARVVPYWFQVPFKFTCSTSHIEEGYFHPWDPAAEDVWIRGRDPLSIKEMLTERTDFIHFLMQ